MNENFVVSWAGGLIPQTVPFNSDSAQWLSLPSSHLPWAALRWPNVPHIRSDVQDSLWEVASPAFWKGTERAKDQTGQRRNRSWAKVFCMPPWPEARWGQWRFPRLQVYPTVTLSILSELFPSLQLPHSYCTSEENYLRSIEKKLSWRTNIILTMASEAGLWAPF